MSAKKTPGQDTVHAERAKIEMAQAKKQNQSAQKKEKPEFDSKNTSMGIEIETIVQSWPDVVCGKKVMEPVHTFTHKETVYAFCSADCRRKFAEDPKEYI